MTDTSDEVKELKQELARDREQTAIEDPLQQKEIQKAEEIEPIVEKNNYIKPYGSIRVHTRTTDGTSFISDSASRIGADGQWNLSAETNAFFRLEAGVDFLNELDKIFSSKTRSENTLLSDLFFKRLLYVGLETPSNLFTFGKTWSTYYKVAYFTDRFDVDGGQASGTYNAGTDGGQTGTGRANMALQTRLHIETFPQPWKLKPFNLNFQFQYGQPIPQVDGAHYGSTIGISALLSTRDDLTVGIAYNHAVVSDKEDPAVKAARISGNAQALLIGLRLLYPKWYFASTLSRTLNHVTTTQFLYYDAIGLEVYSHYDVAHRLNLVAGLNHQRPDDHQDYVGQTQTKYVLLGLRYTFDELRRYIYVETRLDDSRTVDGKRLGSSLSFGVRWDFM